MLGLKDTELNRVLGNIDETPIFGGYFMKNFPVVLVGIFVLHLGNIYGWILDCFGLSLFRFVDEFD